MYSNRLWIPTIQVKRTWGVSGLVQVVKRCTHMAAAFCSVYPKGPSSPYLWLLVPKKALKSYNREYLDPLGLEFIL